MIKPRPADLGHAADDKSRNGRGGTEVDLPRVKLRHRKQPSVSAKLSSRHVLFGIIIIICSTAWFPVHRSVCCLRFAETGVS